MKTDEGNKLIAEFVAIKRCKHPGGMGNMGYKYPFKIGQADWYSEDCMKFHSSWDWLMPVVEKIAKMRFKYDNADEWYSPYPTTFGMVDDEGNYMVRIYASQVFSAPTLIEAAWNAVVDFIEWHSTQTQVKK